MTYNAYLLGINIFENYSLNNTYLEGICKYYTA